MGIKEVKASGILMPEVVLYNTIKSIFDIVKKDFQDESLENSIIYQMFGEDECLNKIKIDNWDYLAQAKQLFSDEKRAVQVNMGYNMQVSDKVCVHIMLPNESGRHLGIGADENYQGYVSNPQNGTHQAVFTEAFDASYNLVITSENTMEVLMVYNFLKAAFISLYSHIELSGLRLPKISGADIQLQSDLVPTHIFHRSLSLSFMYEVNVPDLLRKRLVKNFKITGITLENNNEDVSC